jgi:methylmalonyl-CoA mutase
MSGLSLADDFAVPAEADWRALVDKVLKGGDFERRLVTRTADGARIAPLYTRRDALPGAATALPGAAPFTRGRQAAGAAGWDIRQVYAEPDPAKVNAAIREDLEGGVTSLLLQIAAPGWFGLPYTGPEMAAALDGVLLDMCPVSLLAGEYTVDAAGSLMALWRKAGIADDKCLGAFNADPLGTLAMTGALYHPLARSLDIAAKLAADTRAMPGVTALRADGHIYHAGGATEAQELACVLATLAAYLRACEGAGLAPEDALPKMAVTLAVDADQFLGIAKLRAARRLVWRLAEACGAGTAAARVPLAAETSHRMMTKRDPWVNMLRTTIACAAAAMGAADSIMVLPFTWALGRPDAFARRIARNTHHVLMEESALGRVADPAGGSWYVEQLTDELARKGWELFQAIEGQRGADGMRGMGAALASGYVQDELAKSAEARARKIATRQLELTGTSAFPLLGPDGVTTEPWPAELLDASLNGAHANPVRMHRDAEPFEALRDVADAHTAATGKPPAVFVAALGDLASHAARATWIGSFLAAGGIAASVSAPLTASAEAGKAFADSGLAVAVIAGSDTSYAELGEATAGALKAAGARTVLLAGRPKEQEAALRAAGVDDFIFAGGDAVAMLTKLQAAAGVAR